MPIAEVVRLIDLVNYQEGAVVSRTLVNRATGTLTLFAFDDGQGLSEHTAQFDAVARAWRGAPAKALGGRRGHLVRFTESLRKNRKTKV
jgi:hypothetical protein